MPSKPKGTKNSMRIKKLIVASKKSRCYVLMNAGTFNNDPQKTPSPNGYYLAYMVNKDVTAMPYSN